MCGQASSVLCHVDKCVEWSRVARNWSSPGYSMVLVDLKLWTLGSIPPFSFSFQEDLGEWGGTRIEKRERKEGTRIEKGGIKEEIARVDGPPLKMTLASLSPGAPGPLSVSSFTPRDILELHLGLWSCASLRSTASPPSPPSHFSLWVAKLLSHHSGVSSSYQCFSFQEFLFPSLHHPLTLFTSERRI